MLFSLKSLITVLTIGVVTLLIAKSNLSDSEKKEQFNFIATSWVILTITAFLIPTIWAFSLVTIIIFTSTKGKNSALIAFPLLLISFPPVSQEIPGFGLARYLFELTPARLFTIVLLIPTAVKLFNSNEQKIRRGAFADKGILLYFALDIAIYVSFRSLTENLRALVLIFIDAIIPYYVYSRQLNKIDSVKDVFFYTTIGASIVGFIGLFEALNGWQTYSTVPINWNSDASLMNYLQRDGILRGIGSTGHAIILGYISVLSIGMWMQPKSINKINLKMYFLLAGIICGMISSFSRGSWLGAVALIISYYTVKNRIALFGATKPIGIIILLFIIIAQTPYWNKIESLLPFIGTVDASNLTYRQKLLEYSLQIILDSPFFGNPYFIAYLEDLRQGQGIIDIVNSYLAIALRSGIIGLGIFLACFIFAIIALYKNIKANNDRKNESAKTIAIIFAILVMIASTSSIGIVPVVFWMVLGISSQLTSYNNKISN